MGERKCIPNISHARVSATSCTISHASRLTASEAAWECERELHLPCKWRHTRIAHTHTRIARSLLQLREQISLTLLTHSQRKLDLCVSLSLTSLLRLLFFSTFCRCWSAVVQSVENALLLCVVRAAAAAHRVAQPVSAHAQRYVACLNLLPIIVNCNWQ